GKPYLKITSWATPSSGRHKFGLGLLDGPSWKPLRTTVIICHCKVVNDQAVTRAIADGAHTVAQVCRATGAGSDCGSCVFTLKRLLCEHQESLHAAFPEVEDAAS
ncbi:MAG: (2Fe-2S)-binding protein, partial [Jiangellaceae bacterium]